MAYVTVYFYDKVTKKPLNRCQNNRYFNFEVIDGLNKNVGYYSKETKDFENIRDYSSFTKEIPIDDKFKGGLYKVKFNQETPDSAKFFVLAFNNRSSGVVTDWNLESVKPKDNLSGKVTIKTFSKDFSAYKTVTADYSFSNSEGKVLQEKKETALSSPTFGVSLDVPENLGGLLVFQVVFDLDGEKVSYKKEFQEVQFDDVKIDFTIATGRVFVDGKNIFYFVASKGEKKIFRTQI